MADFYTLVTQAMECDTPSAKGVEKREDDVANGRVEIVKNVEGLDGKLVLWLNATTMPHAF